MAFTIEKYSPLAPLLPPAQLEAVVASFYDRVYAHPWIGRYFAHVDQRKQEFDLVMFIQHSWEDRAYPRRQERYLRDVHAHLFITDELFEVRQSLFAAALRHHGHGEELVAAFLDFNERWRPFVVKSSIEECSDAIADIVAIPRPAPEPDEGGSG